MRLGYLAKWFGFLFLALAINACSDDDDDFEIEPPPEENGDPDLTLRQAVEEDGRFSSWLTAFDDEGLEQNIEGDGPFTVFVFSDEAFERLPEDSFGELDDQGRENILLYHIVPGRLTAGDIGSLTSVTSEQGAPVQIAVREGVITLNGVTEVIETIQVSNGVIHVVDSVLLPLNQPFPGTISDALQAFPVFEQLVGALEGSDLLGVLDDPQAQFTVFAPVNTAFRDAGNDLENATPQFITDTLTFHVVPSVFDANAVLATDELATVQGQPMTFDTTDGELLINDNARLLRQNLIAANGIIHVIDQVLIVPDPIQ